MRNGFKRICVQWGYWATPRIGTEYPCLSVSVPIPVDKSQRRVMPINEELALRIERCVLVMRQVTPELYELFMATYAYRLPLYSEYDRNRRPIRTGLLEGFGISKARYFNQIKIAEISLKLMLAKDECVFLA